MTAMSPANIKCWVRHFRRWTGAWRSDELVSLVWEILWAQGIREDGGAPNKTPMLVNKATWRHHGPMESCGNETFARNGKERVIKVTRGNAFADKRQSG